MRWNDVTSNPAFSLRVERTQLQTTTLSVINYYKMRYCSMHTMIMHIFHCCYLKDGLAKVVPAKFRQQMESNACCSGAIPEDGNSVSVSSKCCKLGIQVRKMLFEPFYGMHSHAKKGET